MKYILEEVTIYKVYQDDNCFFAFDNLDIDFKNKIFINVLNKELDYIDENNIFDLLNYLSLNQNIILKAIEIKT